MQANKQKIAAIVITILLLGNAVLGYMVKVQRDELAAARGVLEQNEKRGDILKFLELFVDKVLRAKEEIGFDARLELEAAVRGLKDSEILNAWEAFVKSADEAEAQENVKNLLHILISKISV